VVVGADVEGLAGAEAPHSDARDAVAARHLDAASDAVLVPAPDVECLHPDVRRLAVQLRDLPDAGRPDADVVLGVGVADVDVALVIGVGSDVVDAVECGELPQAASR
jgi:hypothetical protein